LSKETKKVPLSPEFDDDNRYLLFVFIENKEALGRHVNSKNFDEYQLDPVIKLMCQRCLNCAQAIGRLLTFGHLEESVMLFRSLIETTVNIGFINCSDSKAVEMMYDYTRQSILRSMDSIYEFAGTRLHMKSVPGYSLNDACKEIIDEYTNKKGKPIRDWTKREFGVEKRIEAILKEFKGAYTKALPMVFISHYADASELLHSTLHGINKFLLGHKLSVDRKEYDKIALDNRTGLMLLHLQGLNIALLTLFELTSKNKHDEIKEYVDSAKKLADAQKKIFAMDSP